MIPGYFYLMAVFKLAYEIVKKISNYCEKKVTIN